MHIVKSDVVKKILIAWVISPLFAGIVAFGLMRLI
jgi:phosphate/sulfate permease